MEEVTTNTTPDDLRDKIRWIDALVQEAADTIDALAQGARACLRDADSLASVYRLIGAIEDRAEQLMNSINFEAESVGAAHDALRDRAWLDETRIGLRWQRNTDSAGAGHA